VSATAPVTYDSGTQNVAINIGTGLTTTTGNLVADFGSVAGKITQGNDSRLSDARTPTAHASTHATAGSDPITLAQSQVTSLTTDLAAKAPLASPALTGTPTGPTATAGTNTTQLATTAFVQTAASPANAYEYRTGRYYDTLWSAALSTSSTNIANRMWFHPFVINKPITIKSLSMSLSGSPNSGTMRIGIYSDVSGTPTTLILDAGTIATTSNGVKTISSLNTTLNPGVYWMMTWQASGSGGSVTAYLSSTFSPPNIVGSATLFGITYGFYLSATASTYASAFSTYGTSWTETSFAHQVQMGT